MNRTTTQEERDAVLAKIHEDELVELVLNLCNIPSPYGMEKEAGDFVYDWMHEHGFAPKRVGITDERFNVVGKLRGSGNGCSMLYSSHLDTTGPKGQDIDRWRWTDLEKPYWHSAWIEGETFHGQGVENDKGPMSCFMIAAKALRESGIDLPGDLFITACPGEMGQEPVDEFRGLPYLSKEVGAEYMMIHGGITADYGIAAEGTDFGVSWVEAGKAFFKITVHGRAGYTPFVDHAEKAIDHRSPIVKASVLIQTLNEWAREYENRYRTKTRGGEIIPKVQIGAIKGGHPHYIIGGTEICELYLDCRLIPGMVPGTVKRELEAVAKSTGLEADVELFLFRQGYEADYEQVTPFVSMLGAAHSDLFNSELEMAAPAFSSMWRDHTVFNEYRVASVTYGPSRFTPTVDDLLKCTQVYALAALEVLKKPH